MNVARKVDPEAAGAAGSEAQVRRAREALENARNKSKAHNAERAKDRVRDQELVDKAKAGDGPSFRKLVEFHQSRLFAVAYGMLRDRDDAMDVVQDAFIKAHKKLAEFEGNAAFSTWLYRICVNLCIDKKRADARRRKVDLDDALATDDSLYADADISGRLTGSNPLKTTTDKELGKEIGRALTGLSEDHKSILLLREVEGMSYEEIAETLGIPRGTVMSRLFHARKNMQRQLRPFLGLEEGAGLTGDPDDGDHGAEPEDSGDKKRHS